MVKANFINTYRINANVSYKDVCTYLHGRAIPHLVDTEQRTIYITKAALFGLNGSALIVTDSWADSIPANIRGALSAELWEITMNNSTHSDINALIFQK